MISLGFTFPLMLCTPTAFLAPDVRFARLGAFYSTLFIRRRPSRNVASLLREGTGQTGCPLQRRQQRGC